MQRITVNTIVRPDRQKEGLQPLYIRIIADRKKTDIRVPHYINPKDLLPNGSVKNSCFNSWAINQDIQFILTEINKVIAFLRLNDTTFTLRSFNNIFRKKTDTTSLHNFIRTQAAQMAISENRKHSYNSLATHIEKYFPKINLANCDYAFLVELENCFKNKLQLMQNTISSYMCKLRAILSAAVKNKLIKETPFIHYKIKSFKSTRQPLEKEDIFAIEKYYRETTNNPQKNIAAIFLFLCYTGLRIGDFKRLQFADIKNGGLNFIQGKTKGECFVPLNVPALRFVTETGFNFYKISAEKINEGLKVIAKKTEITKPLTCHVARHTFGTLSVLLKMDLLSISKIMGHEKISTTMIYAKMPEETKHEEMKKWNTFLGF